MTCLTKKIICLLSALSLISQILICQVDSAGFKLDLTVRYRFESWNGYNAKNYGDDGPSALGDLNDKILMQRIILGTTYTHSEKLSASVHIQDARAFGWSLRNSKYPDMYKIPQGVTESAYYTMNPQEEYFELYDLNIEYRDLLKNLSVKAGRQKIYYGDNRIFASSLWGNTGRWTWDAVKISYKKGENYIDVFGGGTKIHDPLKMSFPFTDTEFWGGGSYSHLSLTGWLDAEPFYALKTDGSADYIKTQTINRNWIGLRIVNPEQQNLIYDMLYTREFGNENGKRISAFGYNIKAGYRFTSLTVDPALTIQYTYASGDKKSDNVINTFDPAFGARCRFYGWMSIANWSNISYPDLVLELTPPGGMMHIEMIYNRFYVPGPQECVLLNTMKLKDGKHHLGDEADILILYQPFDKWQFTGICGYFKPGDLEMINYRDPVHAFWGAIQVLFTLN